MLCESLLVQLCGELWLSLDLLLASLIHHERFGGGRQLILRGEDGLDLREGLLLQRVSFLQLFEKVVLPSLQLPRLRIFLADLLDLRFDLRRFLQTNLMLLPVENGLVKLTKTALTFSDLVPALLVLLQGSQVLSLALL